MMRKSGMQISMNLVVMLSLAVATFILAIGFLFKFYAGSTSVSLYVGQDSRLELESMLSSGKRVAVYPKKLEIAMGQSASFAVGILNVLPEDEHLFNATISFVRATGLNGDILCSQGKSSPDECTADGGDADSWLVSDRGSPEGNSPGSWSSSGVTVKRGDKQDFIFAISVPENAYAGTYIYDIIGYSDLGRIGGHERIIIDILS